LELERGLIFANEFFVMRHFLKETDFSRDEIRETFLLATAYKEGRGRDAVPFLHNQTWGLLFYKNSTRTRVSFEVGIGELGGRTVYLDHNAMQIGRGETLHDTAKVLSRYLSGLVIRTYGQEVVDEIAEHATIPVVNGLTDFLHPCQIYSDALTIAEKLGDPSQPFETLAAKKLAFLGDTSCNMANSWILGGAMLGMEIVLAGPPDHQPSPEIRSLLEREGLVENFTFTSDASEAVANADVVYTDVWVSMGCENEEQERLAKMRPYAVTQDLMAQAKTSAIFMHCMPTHPGLEVSQEVLDSSQSVIFDQAENRLHAQKAIVTLLAQKATAS
jgi:ornithine carbamoyltransferase